MVRRDRSRVRRDAEPFLLRHLGGRATLLAVLPLVVAISGCSTGSVASVGPSASVASATDSAATTPAASTAGQQGGWSWGVGETPGAEEGVNLSDGEPGGPDDLNVGDPGSTAGPGGEVGPDVELTTIDPCSLVMPAEWSEFTGETSLAPVQLTADDACGWMDGADTVRMAIAVVSYGNDASRYVSAAEAEQIGRETLTVGGLASMWLAAWPFAESSTLIVGLEGRDLVLEVSALDPERRSSLREMATHFAELALGRLP